MASSCWLIFSTSISVAAKEHIENIKGRYLVSSIFKVKDLNIDNELCKICLSFSNFDEDLSNQIIEEEEDILSLQEKRLHYFTNKKNWIF